MPVQRVLGITQRIVISVIPLLMDIIRGTMVIIMWELMMDTMEDIIVIPLHIMVHMGIIQQFMIMDMILSITMGMHETIMGTIIRRTRASIICR